MEAYVYQVKSLVKTGRPYDVFIGYFGILFFSDMRK